MTTTPSQDAELFAAAARMLDHDVLSASETQSRWIALFLASFDHIADQDGQARLTRMRRNLQTALTEIDRLTKGTNDATN